MRLPACMQNVMHNVPTQRRDAQIVALAVHTTQERPYLSMSVRAYTWEVRRKRTTGALTMQLPEAAA